MKDLIELFRNDNNIKDDSMYNLSDVFDDDVDEVVDEHRILDDIFPDDIEHPDDAEYDLSVLLTDDDTDDDTDDSDEEKFVEIEGRLNLTSTQMNDISTVSRERKFNFTKSDMLYNKTYTDKAENFVNNYRFLISISNSITDEAIIKKLDSFLEPYKELYLEFLKLTVKLSSNFLYGKSSALRNLADKLLVNDDKINKFIDEVYSLGKVVSQYNPDSEIGMS